MTRFAPTKISTLVLMVLSSTWFSAPTQAQEEDLDRALKRAQYILHGTFPSDKELRRSTSDRDSYNDAIRSFIDNSKFYNAALRYHQRLFGVGLPIDYLDELRLEDLDMKTNKFATIECDHLTVNGNSRFECYWASRGEGAEIGDCPEGWKQPVTAFWYPTLTAWVCPTVVRSCGEDLSRCFIQYPTKTWRVIVSLVRQRFLTHVSL